MQHYFVVGSISLELDSLKFCFGLNGRVGGKPTPPSLQILSRPSFSDWAEWNLLWVSAHNLREDLKFHICREHLYLRMPQAIKERKSAGQNNGVSSTCHHILRRFQRRKYINHTLKWPAAYLTMQPFRLKGLFYFLKSEEGWFINDLRGMSGYHIYLFIYCFTAGANSFPLLIYQSSPYTHSCSHVKNLLLSLLLLFKMEAISGRRLQKGTRFSDRN